MSKSEEPIPNKKAALVKVASALGASLSSGGIEDLLGYVDPEWSDAEIGRIEWAMEEVQRRLFAMADRND